MSEPGIQRCPNCDGPAPGSFCPRCGQATRERRAPFWDLLRELFDHLDFDSKLPRSLYCLLARPGRLTRLYLAGKRASYVPPLRMYLVISLVFFVVFDFEPPDASTIEVKVGDQVVGATQPRSGDEPEKKTTIQIVNEKEEDPGWFGRLIEDRLVGGKRERFLQMDPQDLIDGWFRGLGRYVKLALFAFLPLLALVLRLLFLRSDYLYFDHLIFALHFQSFLFLSLLIVWALPYSFWRSVPVLLLVVVPGHLLLALRRVYRRSPRWLFAKFLALGLAYLVIFGLAFWVVMLAVLQRI